jgi:hypothetical protein
MHIDHLDHSGRVTVPAAELLTATTSSDLCSEIAFLWTSDYLTSSDAQLSSYIKFSDLAILTHS